MFLSKGLILFSSLALITSCTNGGGAPSNAAGKDYMALAMAMEPSVTYTIPGDLTVDCYFDGTVIPNGQSVTAYQSSTVSTGQSCIAAGEQRTCVDGLLEGTYNYSLCTVDGEASCLFNGKTITNGQSITAFLNSSEEFGDECSQETRTCNNGVLSGGYQYESCSNGAAADCLFNGQTVTNNGSVPAFLTSTVPHGETCLMEYRTCQDGSLSGSNQYSSCSVDAAASCVFNGQTLADGQSVTAFLNSSEEFGDECSQETRTCNNGVLSGGFQFAGCDVGQAASCLFNGQTIAHGQKVNAYATSSTAYGETCSVETRVCDDGHLSGSFEFGSCDAGQASSCLFNGTTIPHGASVTAYQDSTGNSCATEQRTCDNGTLSGSFSYSSCEVNQAAACLFNGQTVQDGQSVVAYKNSEVKEHDVCAAETRVCSGGTLSGTYGNSSCKNKNNSPNDDDDDTIKICKLVVNLKHKQHYSQHPNNGLHLGWYKFKERFDCGKHLGWFKHKNKEDHPSCENNKGWYHDDDEHNGNGNDGHNGNGGGNGNDGHNRNDGGNGSGNGNNGHH